MGLLFGRGGPLQFIQDENTYSVPSQSFALDDADGDDFESVAVIQSLANHDPDVDAIYRMTNLCPSASIAKKQFSCLCELHPLERAGGSRIRTRFLRVTVAVHRDGTSERYLAKLHHNSSFVGNTVQNWICHTASQSSFLHRPEDDLWTCGRFAPGARNECHYELNACM